MAMLGITEAEVEASPDGQVSLTDPDARAMATSGRGSGIVYLPDRGVYRCPAGSLLPYHMTVVEKGTFTCRRSDILRQMDACRATSCGRG